MNCHNGEKYLHQSLKSILNQKYKNWELIFWDNFSKDRSKKILKKIKDKRIKYFFSKKFLKLYHSRNLAIRKAKGQYISFLDTDDLWHKEKLNRQINFLKKKKLLVCFSNFYIKNESSGKLKKFNSQSNYNTNTSNLIKNYRLGILTALIHRSFFEKKKFKTIYNIIGDFDYFIDLSLRTKIAYLNQPLATYRVHGKNFSKNFKVHLQEIKKWKKENQKKFEKKKINLKQINFLIIKLFFKNFLSSIIK